MSTKFGWWQFNRSQPRTVPTTRASSRRTRLGLEQLDRRDLPSTSLSTPTDALAITARMGVEPTPFQPSRVAEVNTDGGAGKDSVSASGFVDPATLVGFNPQPEPPIVRV